MKLYKKFNPSVAEYKNQSINSALASFKSSHRMGFGMISGKNYSFTGYGSGIKTEYAYLHSIQVLKRGKYKNMKKVYITYYVIPMKLIEVLGLVVEQKSRYFTIKPYHGK